MLDVQLKNIRNFRNRLSVGFDRESFVEISFDSTNIAGITEYKMALNNKNHFAFIYYNTMISAETTLIVNEHPERKKWDDYVYNHPNGTIFQTSLMFDVYQSTPLNNAHVMALEDANKNILGLMVYVLINEPGVKGFFSTRAIVTGGPLVSGNNIHYTKALLSEYTKKIKKTGAIYTEIRNLFGMQAIDTAIVSERFVYQDHLTIHMNLGKSAEELTKSLHKKRAANIRRAIKKNVVTKDISKQEDITTAHSIIKDTYERIGLPAPRPELFLNAAKILGNNIKFFAAYLDNKIIGCRVYLVYKDIIYDWYAAGDKAYAGYHPNDLLPWNAMLWAKENNFKVYDFAGAGKPDKEYLVRDYKLKFGGNLLSFGRYQHIHKPLLYKFGVLGLKVYKYIR